MCAIFGPILGSCAILKIFVCIKDAFSLHFAKFRVVSFWNACFCSSIAFWLVVAVAVVAVVVWSLLVFCCDFVVLLFFVLLVLVDCFGGFFCWLFSLFCLFLFCLF